VISLVASFVAQQPVPRIDVPNIDWFSIAPEVSLFGAALLIVLVRSLARRSRHVFDVSLLIAAAGVITSAVFTGVEWHFIDRDGPYQAISGMVAADGFSIFVRTIVLVSLALGLLVSVGYLRRERLEAPEYVALMMLSATGMMVMATANDLIAVFLALEILSIALYVLSAFDRNRLTSQEAGLKYFLLGAFSSAVFLYGVALVYGATGTTSLTGIAKFLATTTLLDNGVLFVGFALLLVGLGFKVAAAPFHMWTPDVYEGAPTPVTMLFSVAPKVAAVSLFVTTMIGPFRPLLLQWQQVIIVVAVLSMVLGAFAAIGQNNIKRLMAYSSIGNVGYMLLGLAAGTQDAARGILVYLIIYVFMNVGIFGCILFMKRKGEMIETIPDLAGLSRRQPLVALALAAFMFSQAGIPPLAGFFGKLYIFIPVINAGLYVPAVIGVVASVVAAYYYLRIVKVAYFDAPAEPFDQPVERDIAVLVGVAGAFVAGFIVFTGPVLQAANAAAASLFAG
jgi:NADH-quinone oxidoreductase subunit N